MGIKDLMERRRYMKKDNVKGYNTQNFAKLLGKRLEKVQGPKT